jgi:hypothetical protein
MKCIYCGGDSKFKERPGKSCPRCGKTFAFEPKSGDPFTDPAFQSAIDAVSANGQVRWGVEHLYYELCRRRFRKGIPRGVFVVLTIIGLFILVANQFSTIVVILMLILAATLSLLWKYGRPVTVRLSQTEFDRLWSCWISVHGEPKAVIIRKEQPVVARPREADIGDYSFDRAVICDRARTVDLLLANNFHFENNCAILSVGGYPEGPFELVKTMLKRNPKLQVFALHDATVAGCRLAYKLAHDPEWFKGHVPVTDVGIRPQHASPFKGLFLPVPVKAQLNPDQGVTAEELLWLNQYALEIAAIRPEQILKRLFKAINKREEQASGRDTSSTSGNGSVYTDDDSFSAPAGDSDGGADSFG